MTVGDLFKFTIQEIQELTGLSQKQILDAVENGEVDFQLVGKDPYVFTIKNTEKEMVFSREELCAILGVNSEQLERMIFFNQVDVKVLEEDKYLVSLDDLGNVVIDNLDL